MRAEEVHSKEGFRRRKGQDAAKRVDSKGGREKRKSCRIRGQVCELRSRGVNQRQTE